MTTTHGTSRDEPHTLHDQPLLITTAYQALLANAEKQGFFQN